MVLLFSDRFGMQMQASTDFRAGPIEGLFCIVFIFSDSMPNKNSLHFPLTKSNEDRGSHMQGGISADRPIDKLCD